MLFRSALILFLPVLFIVTASLFESSKMQATPGKLMLGLRVGRRNGARTDLQTALKRNGLKTLANVFLLLTEKNAELFHDRATDTKVYYSY